MRIDAVNPDVPVQRNRRNDQIAQRQLMAASDQVSSQKRREEEKARPSAKEETVEQPVSPEEAERAKEAIRVLLGRSLFRSQSTGQQSSETDRRAFLLAQARQLEQIERFGSLNAWSHS